MEDQEPDYLMLRLPFKKGSEMVTSGKTYLFFVGRKQVRLPVSEVAFVDRDDEKGEYCVSVAAWIVKRNHLDSYVDRGDTE